MSVVIFLAVSVGVIGCVVIAGLAVWSVRTMRPGSATDQQPNELVLPGGIIYRIDPKNLAIAEARFNEILRQLPR
jgi:hypothetical protein